MVGKCNVYWSDYFMSYEYSGVNILGPEAVYMRAVKFLAKLFKVELSEYCFRCRGSSRVGYRQHVQIRIPEGFEDDYLYNNEDRKILNWFDYITPVIMKKFKAVTYNNMLKVASIYYRLFAYNYFPTYSRITADDVKNIYWDHKTCFDADFKKAENTLKLVDEYPNFGPLRIIEGNAGGLVFSMISTYGHIEMRYCYIYSDVAHEELIKKRYVVHPKGIISLINKQSTPSINYVFYIIPKSGLALTKAVDYDCCFSYGH